MDNTTGVNQNQATTDTSGTMPATVPPFPNTPAAAPVAPPPPMPATEPAPLVAPAPPTSSFPPTTPTSFQTTPPATPSFTQAPPVFTPPPTQFSSTAPQPPMPVQPAASDFKPEAEGKSKLPLLIAGILLILALAGGYFLYTLYQMPTVPTVDETVEETVAPTVAPSPTMTEEENAQMEIQNLEQVSPSDEIPDLEQDIDNTNLNTLDQGLQ